jgi:hypothetical protein
MTRILHVPRYLYEYQHLFSQRLCIFARTYEYLTQFSMAFIQYFQTMKLMHTRRILGETLVTTHGCNVYQDIIVCTFPSNLTLVLKECK